MADTVGRAWPLERDKVEKAVDEAAARKRVSISALAFAVPAAVALRFVSRSGRRRPPPGA
jgi:hypothetical protein